MLSSVNLIQRKGQRGPAFLAHVLFGLKYRKVRLSFLGMNPPRRRWIIINRLFNRPILLIEVSRGILQRDCLNCGRIVFEAAFTVNSDKCKFPLSG